MNHTRIVPFRPAAAPVGLLRGALLLGLLAGTASAQQTSPAWGGSESQVAPAVGIAAGGGKRSSAAYGLEASFGRPGLQGASSPAYVFDGGPLSAPESIKNWGPLLFGARPDLGDKLGNDFTRLYGYKLGNAVDVELGGQPVLGFTPFTSNTLDVVTPLGVNGYGNPLGRVDAGVVISGGSPYLPRGYRFGPLLQNESEPTIGSPYRIRYRGEPMSVAWLAFGLKLQNVAIPVPPFEGAIEVILKYKLFGLKFAPEGHVDWAFNIPDDPDLVGAPLGFQCLSITAPDLSAGAYTNVLESTILP